MRLLVTRPEPDAAELAARLEAAGHAVSREPLLIIEPVHPPPTLDLGGVQALVATSRSALRALAQNDALSTLRQLPLLTVGPGTAAAARAAGFARIVGGAGAAVDLVDLARSSLDPAAGVLLHLSGGEVAFDLVPPLSEAGYAVHRQIVYRTSAPARLSPETERLLQQRAIGGIVLMSPRTASVYAELIAQHGLGDRLGGIVHFCLSAAVAQRLAALGEVVKAISRQPNLEEMLALIARMAPQSCESLDHKS